MNALVRLHGVAAALPQPDINTDLIAPLVRGGPGGGQPVGIRSPEELASRLFGPWRWQADGSENPDFILNRQPWRQARFLVAGPNFACGSSRETAATMLKAFGIRCVIAPSFGQIFHDNCFRNHMLPLALDAQLVDRLVQRALQAVPFQLDLAAGTLAVPGEPVIPVRLPAFRRDMLLSGQDELDLNLRREPQIAAWQEQAWRRRPWEHLLPSKES
ncbi:3-isopropylmalate dehydratase small subunit [Ramlibacter sp. AW1]|uniref:3-isopropylmalate dehydratase n=1 Tax=Ramlibacter aurantiacus TaxID=2801330 RepID=A0A936ZK28_9BURK|nr:3-isopropylmalate dehydratase small subunit [Ramlibacter aurantiacus]MBL0421648.1 3-isopropylmalate dehydratase small subunit [Ramlibacter aurantiacus]